MKYLNSTLYEIGIIKTLILLANRLREMRYFALGHTASKGQIFDLESA